VAFKKCKNVFSADRALPRTPLDELTMLPGWRHPPNFHARQKDHPTSWPGHATGSEYWSDSKIIL